jgi:hypothetical protein
MASRPRLPECGPPLCSAHSGARTHVFPGRPGRWGREPHREEGRGKHGHRADMGRTACRTGRAVRTDRLRPCGILRRREAEVAAGRDRDHPAGRGKGIGPDARIEVLVPVKPDNRSTVGTGMIVTFASTGRSRTVRRRSGHSGSTRSGRRGGGPLVRRRVRHQGRHARRPAGSSTGRSSGMSSRSSTPRTGTWRRTTGSADGT